MSDDKKPGIVPISDVRSIGKKRNCLMVLLFAIEEDAERFTITTWGKTKKLCTLAGSYGEKIRNGIMSGKIAPPLRAPIDIDDPIYLVGQNKKGKQWEFQGIFTDLSIAVSECKNSNYWIAHIKINEKRPEKTSDFKKYMYPKIKVEWIIR